MCLVKRKKWDKTVKQKKNEGSKYVKQKIEDFIVAFYSISCDCVNQKGKQFNRSAEFRLIF